MSESKGNGQAMVVARADSRTALEPKNFDEGWRLAEIAATTRMYGVTSPEDAFLRMSTGMGLGLSAPQSLRGLFTISGKVGISADLMMALSQQHPACRYFHCVETTNEIATFATKRGENEEVRLSFTMAEAREAGLVGQNQNYKKYPAAMLRARCIAALARLVYPEALHGLYTREEFGETEREPMAVEPAAPRVEVTMADPQRRPDPAPPTLEEITDRAIASAIEAAREQDAGKYKHAKAQILGYCQRFGVPDVARDAAVERFKIEVGKAAGMKPKAEERVPAGNVGEQDEKNLQRLGAPPGDG